MDYEKLHKDTITKLREMVNSGKITVEVARGICADFEPESEDERIRKAIKSAVLQLTDIYLQEKYGLKQSDCIAWLEKQGEQKPADKIQLGKIYKCIASPRYSTFRIGEIYKPEDKFLCSLMNFCSDCFEPIEHEQKPTDKVEPKFKVGDKIKLAKEPKYPAREIIAIQNDAYYFDKAVHLPFSSQDEWELVEQKPVLSENESKQKQDVSIQINSSEYINDMGGNGCYLKNVTQASAWSKEDEKMLDDIHEFFDKHKINPLKHDMDDYAKFIKSLKDRVQPQPIQDWSEEDEHRINDTIYFLETAKKHYASTVELDACIDWLKSLKDRVLPQPKQEWSDEDAEMLETCISLMSCNDAAEEETEWLKSLRPQPKQPLDEDTQQWIDSIIKDYEDKLVTDTEHCATINAKIHILKSLRPQSQWKPSKEQMDALLFVVQHYTPNVTDKLAWDSIKILELMYYEIKEIKL